MSDAQEMQQMLNRVNAARSGASGQVGPRQLSVAEVRAQTINDYENGWEMQGGSAGYDMSPAIRAQYQSMRDAAATRQNQGNADLTALYTNLQKSYEGMPAQTNQRYGAAIQGAQASSNQLISDTRARIDSEAAQRASAFAELGLGNDGSLSQAEGQMERGVGDVANTAANWGGLLGAQQQSQVTRDNLNYTGAADAGVLAREDLLRRYNSYLDNVSMQEQQALSSPGVRGGGSSGSMVNNSGISSKIYDRANTDSYLDRTGQMPASDYQRNEWAVARAEQAQADRRELIGLRAGTTGATGAVIPGTPISLDPNRNG